MIDITAPTEGERDGGILGSLKNLERRLLPMVRDAAAKTGREPGADRFQGLYVSEADVWRYLTAPDGLTPLGGAPNALAYGPAFHALGKFYRLSGSELDALLIAMASDLDSRYERIFAYLQDDVARR